MNRWVDGGLTDWVFGGWVIGEFARVTSSVLLVSVGFSLKFMQDILTQTTSRKSSHSVCMFLVFCGFVFFLFCFFSAERWLLNLHLPVVKSASPGR